MDIDEILEIHYASKFISTKSGQNYPIHYGELNPYLKEAIKEIVKETLRMAADNAKVKTTIDVDIDGYPTTFSIVDKDSITNVYNKIKF